MLGLVAYQTLIYWNLKKMKTKSKAATCGKELSLEERVQNAFHASEIEALFDEGDVGMVTVLGKFQVTSLLYHLVAGQLESINMALIAGVEYTTAELVGDLCWSSLDDEGKREMALCIKHFATNPAAKLIDTETGTFISAAD